MNATEGADYCIDCLLAWSGDKQSGSVDESKNSRFSLYFLKLLKFSITFLIDNFL